jgi:A/G-specific adenine glycosylase
LAEVGSAALVVAEWRDLPGNIRHVFTHIDLRLTLVAGRLQQVPEGMLAVPLDQLGDYALPSVMRKIVNAAVKGG